MQITVINDDNLFKLLGVGTGDVVTTTTFDLLTKIRPENEKENQLLSIVHRFFLEPLFLCASNLRDFLLRSDKTLISKLSKIAKKLHTTILYLFFLFKKVVFTTYF